MHKVLDSLYIRAQRLGEMGWSTSFKSERFPDTV